MLQFRRHMLKIEQNFRTLSLICQGFLLEEISMSKVEVHRHY